MSWTVKYKPRHLKEIVGNKTAIQKLVEWVESWKQGVPRKRAAFLFGSPGIGKTATVEALAHDFHMELVEKNASDYRTESAIRRFAGLASQYESLFGRRRIVLLDELDGLTGTADRGGVRAITEIIKIARFPIVLIANNAYDTRFSNLRKYCLLIEFKKPSASSIMKYLTRICVHEGIQAEDTSLKFIAQRSAGDVRSAINDLQALAQNKKKLTFSDVSWLSHRDRHEKIFNVLKLIMYGRTCISAKQAVNMADTRLDMLFEWIYENVPAHLTDPHDLAKAMDALSIADVYRGRIRSTQNWSFTRYVIDYMTAGVAMARQNTKTRGWIPFKFPERIKLLSRSKGERALRRRIGDKIKKKCHISAVRSVKEILPYLKLIFESNVNMAAGLADWFDFDRKMIEYLVNDERKTEKVIQLSVKS